MTTNNPRVVLRLRAAVLALAAAALVVPGPASAGEVAIQVSPSTLNLSSDGKLVTVHADISFDAVNGYSVWLSGVPITSWKADDRGDFVAKFLMSEIKSIPDLEPNTVYELVFDGETNDDPPVPIWGRTEVRIVDRG